MMLRLAGVDLPTGWTAESWHGQDSFAICKPGVTGGAVTVSFEKRTYRAGMTIMGEALGSGFTGRGWRQALVRAAIEWLESVTRE